MMNAILSKFKNEDFEFLYGDAHIQFLRDRIFIIDPEHGELYYSQQDPRSQKYENVIDDILHGAQEMQKSRKTTLTEEEAEQFRDVLNAVSLPNSYQRYMSSKGRQEEKNKPHDVEEELKGRRFEGFIDHQWDNTIKLVGMVVKNCKSTEHVLVKLRMLCHNPEEFDKFIESED